MERGAGYTRKEKRGERRRLGNLFINLLYLLLIFPFSTHFYLNFDSRFDIHLLKHDSLLGGG